MESRGRTNNSNGYKNISGSKRIEGDKWYYFIIHSIFSGIIFFFFAINLGLLSNSSETISELISINFFFVILIVFVVSVISSILGRVISYYFIKTIIVYVPRYISMKKNKPFNLKEMRRFWELNTGINKMGYLFLIASLLSSLFFSIGALTIVQSKIFGTSNIYTLVTTYFVLMVVVQVLARYLVQRRL